MALPASASRPQDGDRGQSKRARAGAPAAKDRTAICQPVDDARTFDIAIIGAGVVGCAIFREMCLAGARCILLERYADILAGASKGNSAILHTGFDAPPNSLEARCLRDGNRRYRAIHRALNLPLIETAAVVIAWSDADEAALPAIVADAHRNDVHDARIIRGEDLLAREPNLARDARAALFVPGEAIIDPWSAPLAYVLQGIAHGGVVKRQTEVTSGRHDDHGWVLHTSKGDFRARTVFNCAGNFGDLVEAIARPSPFAIRPRKGQFVVFDKSAGDLVATIILPVPNERTKGVVVCPTVFGNLLVGPTAEDQDDRSSATLDETKLRSLIDTGRRIVPKLVDHSITAAYAGLRPATQFKDFQIEALPDRHWISVSGIRSTGLTAALGIAAHVRSLHESHFGSFTPAAKIIWTPVPNLAEAHPRDWQRSGRSTVVCHCEMVTADDIERAFAQPLPAASLGAVKRRTRCMMGRCQGFYCSRRVLEIADGRCGPLAEPID